MSAIKPPPVMKYFLAAFSTGSDNIDRAIELLKTRLGHKLGEPDFSSPDLPLTETRYYEKEMGPGLVKRYLSWSHLMPPDFLVDFKLESMKMEIELARGEDRTINLDPGYVFAGGLILSTGKFTGHRLYLGQGIWGELTLHFHRGQFQALPWTYRDYLRPEVIDLLTKIRNGYMRTTANLSQHL